MIGMTPERLAEIDARLGQITPGPWEVIDSDQGHPAGTEWEVYAPAVKSEDHTGWVCEQSEVHGEDGGIAWSGVGGRRDAEFIAHAPEDIADLRAEVDRLRAQVGHYADQCESWAAANAEHVEHCHQTGTPAWQSSGYMKAYRRVSEDLCAILAGDEVQS